MTGRLRLRVPGTVPGSATARRPAASCRRAISLRRAISRRRADEGSALVELILVVVLLALLTLSVIQLGLALLVRNTVLDAAAEGARHAALAGNGLADGIQRTEQLIAMAVGDAYAGDVRARYLEGPGHLTVRVTVRAPLPLVGLFGVAEGLEVSGHAAVETLE